MQVNLVLDVQVRAPVADLRGAFQLGDFQDRVVVGVVNGDLLLLRLQEWSVRSDRDVSERPVGDRRARLRDRVLRTILIHTIRGRV